MLWQQHYAPNANVTPAAGPGGGFNLRYGVPSSVPQPPREQHQPAALTVAAAVQQLHHSAVQVPQVLQHLQQQQVPAGLLGDQAVLRRVGVAAEGWCECDSSIYFRVEGLSLSADALADPAVCGKHVLLAHMLLEDFTSPVQQCTETALADA